jgi:hypothetical protein
MKQSFGILFLSLMLIPFFWNGLSLFHYMAEHTHTFCSTEQDHEHIPSEDCHTICHFSPDHGQAQIPNKVEFYELQQCITTNSYIKVVSICANIKSTNLSYAHLYSRSFSGNIFRPPIS